MNDTIKTGSVHLWRGKCCQFNKGRSIVDLQHTNSSGEITSPGYPNTGHPLDEAWRIKVNVGHQIRLEVLDFALHCDSDYIEIYDGAFNRYCLVERWCWESFSQLQQTVYISSGNTLYLRLQTMYGHDRKGFNASYISVPIHTTLSSDMDVTSNERFNRRSPKATTLSTLNGLSHSISTTASDTSINTKATPAPTLTTTQPMADLITIFIIPTVLGILLIACFFVGFCCCCCYRKKNKTLGVEAPTITEIQEFRTSKPLDSNHESEIAHLKAEANSESDVFDKTIIEQLIPTYALPNKGDRQVNGSDDDESTSRGHREAEHDLQAINSVKQAGDSFQSADMMDLVCNAHPDGNKTKTKVKDERSSDDVETEIAFNQLQAKHDYAYVDRSSVKGVDISNDVIYSFPDKKKNKSLEMVPNEAYERFDEGEKESKRGNRVDDIPYSVPFEKTSEGSVINEAYQSYDTDEDECNKGGDAAYYYLDKNDKEEIGEPTELFYETV